MGRVIDTKKQFHELPFYKIEELCEKMVDVAISEDDNLKTKYENEYKNKMSRFSSAVAFVVRELKWMVYDPLCSGKDEVLFSNGARNYIASMDYIRSINYDTNSIVNNKTGFLPLTDEMLMYDGKLENTANKTTGIVDKRGFVSSVNFSSLDDLASIILMDDLMKNKDVYEDYMEHKDEFASALEYITSKPNSIGIERLAAGTFTLRFVSENDGLVQDFINRLDREGKIAELQPLVPEEEVIRKVA